MPPRTRALVLALAFALPLAAIGPALQAAQPPRVPRACARYGSVTLIEEVYSYTGRAGRCVMVLDAYREAFGRVTQGTELDTWMELPDSDPRFQSQAALISELRARLKSDAAEREATVKRAYVEAFHFEPTDIEISSTLAGAASSGATFKEIVAGFQKAGQTAKDALAAVFTPEIKKNPTVRDVLTNPKDKAFRSAVADLLVGRNGGGYDGVRSWIEQHRDWYLAFAGIEQQAQSRNIADSYQKAFGRAPADGELKHWQSVPASDPRVQNLDSLVAAHRDWLKSNDKERADTITRSYDRSFNRNPNTTELAYWKDRVARTGETYDEMMAVHRDYPSVSGVRPKSALAGETVSIDGSRFKDVLSVDFGGVPAAGFRVLSDRGIQATVPTLTTLVQVVVTTAAGSSGGGIVSDFRVNLYAPPSVTRVSPGMNLPGTTVEITGTGFATASYVEIGGFPARDYQVVNDTTIRVKVPAGAASGPVRVQTRGGYSAPTTASSFIVGNPYRERISATYSALVNRQATEEEIAAWTPRFAGSPGAGTDLEDAIRGSYEFIRLAAPPPPREPPKIYTNAAGETEICFGAVGKGCNGAGAGNLLTGSQVFVKPVGCSRVENSRVTCWIVPGSIKHDNCCAGHPEGSNCGHGEARPDLCKTEWDQAVSDVFWGRAWTAAFDTSRPDDLTPVPSKRYGPGETEVTIDLCAPAETPVDTRNGPGFCCSGRFKDNQTYWALGAPDWGVCASGDHISQRGAGGRSVQSMMPRVEWPGGTPPASPALAATQKPRPEASAPPSPALGRGAVAGAAGGSAPVSATAETPVAAPVMAETPTEEETPQADTPDAPECDPNVPRYAQPGCAEPGQAPKKAAAPPKRSAAGAATPAAVPGIAAAPTSAAHSAGAAPVAPVAPPAADEEQPQPDSTDAPVCNPDVPRYAQPDCVEPGQAPKKSPVPPRKKPATAAKPKDAQAADAPPCDPNVPRYAQPGCKEAGQ